MEYIKSGKELEIMRSYLEDFDGYTKYPEYSHLFEIRTKEVSHLETKYSMMYTRWKLLKEEYEDNPDLWIPLMILYRKYHNLTRNEFYASELHSSLFIFHDYYMSLLLDVENLNYSSYLYLIDGEFLSDVSAFTLRQYSFPQLKCQTKNYGALGRLFHECGRYITDRCIKVIIDLCNLGIPDLTNIMIPKRANPTDICSTRKSFVAFGKDLINTLQLSQPYRHGNLRISDIYYIKDRMVLSSGTMRIREYGVDLDVIHIFIDIMLFVHNKAKSMLRTIIYAMFRKFIHAQYDGKVSKSKIIQRLKTNTNTSRHIMNMKNEPDKYTGRNYAAYPMMLWLSEIGCNMSESPSILSAIAETISDLSNRQYLRKRVPLTIETLKSLL
jgi:hypothetical protein